MLRASSGALYRPVSLGVVFLVWCVFFLLRLFSFPCFDFQVVRACWVGVPPLSLSECGVLIFSRLMWCSFPRWSASLRQPLRTACTSFCIPSSKAFYSISMSTRPSSLPIFKASWSAFWFFSDIRASGSLVLLYC